MLEDRLAPATLTVNTLADSTGGSQLSLRDAILAVDGGSYSGPATGQVSGTFGSNDTILFASSLNGTISLNSSNGPLAISSSVTITANPTLNAITINGQSKTGVFEVTNAAAATIAGLTITNGKDSTNLFGGISVQAVAALTVNGCTFVSNQSAGAGGGAIINAGTLTVTDSTFNSNSGVVGGAIDNVSGATAVLINCTISGNQATTGSGTGGGVANAGSLTLLNTLIAQNTSAGTDPDVVGAFNSPGHNLIGNATGSTGLTNGIKGDQVGNAAPFTGNLTNGEATIDNVSSTAGLTVGQLITDTDGAIPAGTVIADLRLHSITLSQFATSSQTGDTFTGSVDADLGPLQNNGGGIQTMALLPTSSAIDTGANSNPVLTVPTTDERGVIRPQAGMVDIGAFEATELLVTNLNDSGAGSLRDALTQSNSIPGTVVIDFQPGLTGTISLTTANLEVDHDDWIRGPGASQITVDGNLNYWCFGVNSQYTIAGNFNVAISGLTMTQGKQVAGTIGNDGRGGAISYRDTSYGVSLLTVEDCAIENSVNGGIYAEDGLSVINCQIIDNTGIGIDMVGYPYLDVSNSSIAGNTGQGINTDLNAVVTNCTLSGNGGQGIYDGAGNEALINCTVTGNKSGVDMGSLGGIGTFTNCTIMDNSGDDAITVVGPNGNMIFDNSIVGTMHVQYGIFTSQGNNIFADGFPGTLQSSDAVAPVISSLSAASGGTLASGKYYYEVSAVTSTGTLTSLESSVSVGSDGKVTINWNAPVGTSAVTGYQIFRGAAAGSELKIATVSSGTTSYIDSGSAASGSPSLLLGALADNGGPAPTMALTANGIAFAAGKAEATFAPLTDERGYLRNPLFPDIGAFQSASSTPNMVSLSPAALVGVDQGLGYSQSITASGGTGTGYLIGITSGALPPGLTLDLDGTLYGTATTLGSFTFTATGFDSAGNFGSKNYTLNVNSAPSITTSSLPIGTENAAYSQAIQTSGGTAPFTWSYTGMLPSGVTFNTSNGTFGGTPVAGSAGTYNNIQVTATDSDGESAAQTYTMTVHWVIGLSPALPADTLNTAYNQTQNITGGSGTYSALNVTGLPSGLTASLSGTTLTIGGTPTVTGTFPLSITLHDDGNNSDSNVASETLTVNPALGISTPSLPNWTETLAYKQSIATTGGTGPLTFSLSSGTLPAGLSLNNTTGVISGTPSIGSAGSYPFTVEVTDAAGAGVSRSYTVVISTVSLGALSFNQWTLNKTGFIGTIAASTGTGTFTLSTTSGKLPTGMTDSLSDGLITFAGKPTIAGTYTFTLKLTDSLGVTTTQSNTIVINPATTFVWTGLGADANWTTPGNWSGAGSAPLAGYTLLFGSGATQKTANNNFPSGTQFAALLFQDSGYTITGNSLKLSAGISSTSTAGGADTVATNVALTATETFNIAGTTLVDVTGTISGTLLGITKAGTGTLAYGSPAGNTYTGLTTVNGGTLQLNTSNQIVDTASVAVNVGATFDLNGYDETIANLTLTGGTVNTGIGALTLNGNITSNAATPSASINGNLNLTGTTPTLTVNKGVAVDGLVIPATLSADSLTKLGLGTLALSGDNSSYVGTTKVSSGVIDVQNPAALGSGPVLALVGTTVQLDGNGLTIGNPLTLGSTGGATLKNLDGSNNWSGPITDAVTSTINVSAGTLTINGGIGGAGGLTESGTGTLLLPSANSYLGITTVSAGILDLQTPAALGKNTVMTVASAGTLQIDGTGLNFSETLSLSGILDNLNGSNTWSGKISTLAATSTVNVGAGQSLTLSGIISGAGGLTANKSGSGTLILTNANTYTGATAIKAGIAVVQNKSALGSTVGATTVSSGATLQVEGGLTIAEKITLNGVGAAGTTGALESVAGNNTWSGTMSLASASTIAIDAGQLTISGIISGVGSLTQVGAGSLIVSALNTYTGGTTVDPGTLGGGGKIGALLVDSGATLAPGSTTTQILKTGNVAFSAGSTFTVTLNGTAAGTGYDQLSVTGTVNLAGATLNVNLGFTPALGSAFTLIQNDGIDAVVGTFAGLPQGATIVQNGMTFQISYVGGTGNDVVLTRIA
ncbi:MAG TPA: putative Ig domain-containing protein [Chloroflexota bacterium]|jgi:autotransporter-associated beta strand protein|nr:putative Ig domain-containing protein [Chloroflexota bacterium]